MKNKKVLSMISVFTIAILFNINNISAANITLDAGETSLTANEGTGGSLKTNTPIAYGYRVTFVDPNNSNKRVGNSVDYWGQGKMVSDNACAIDGYICDASKFDWDFISNYSKYQNSINENLKTSILYRYYDSKHSKIEAISGEGSKHYGKYSVSNTYKDFLIPKYRDYLVKLTNCDNLKSEKNVLLSAQINDSCYNNNYVKFAYYSLKEAASKSDYTSYSTLIRDAKAVDVAGKTNAQIVSAARNYIMIVEPLTAIRTNKSGEYTLSNPIYIGTMYELYKMGAITATGGAWTYDRYSYINTKMYNKQAVGGVAACSNGTIGGKIANLDKGGCSGAFTVKIADLFPCASTVNSLFKSYKNKKIKSSEYDSSVQKACTAAGISDCSWLKIGSDEDEPLYKQYGVNPESVTSCDMPTCNTVAKAISSKYSSSSEFKKAMSNLGFKLGSLTNADAYYSNPQIINSNTNLCDATVCNTLLNIIKASKNKVNEKIEALNKITGEKYALLDKTILDETGYEPYCGGIEKCLVNPITPSCDAANSKFTFKDAEKNSDNINCDFSKIAYNSVNKDEVIPKSVQTSVDKTYGKNGYCKEEVSFVFPTNVEKVTGGTIMKWGIDSSKGNAKFGTMKVKRTCFIDSKNLPKDKNFSIKSNWANVIGSSLDTPTNPGKINPRIALYYRDAVADDSRAYKISNKNMNTYLTKVTMSIIGGKDFGKESAPDTAISVYDKSGNFIASESTPFKNKLNTTNYREFKCGSNCSTIYRVVMEADYDIDYSNELNWYSDSSDNFKKKTEKDVKDAKGNIDAKYVSIGYGLPTSFLTPSSFNTWYGESSDKSSGYMYVDLSQIGTKNNDGTYHFDRYTQYYIDGAYKYGEEKGKGSHIKYSCNYSIENILYDYECPDNKCGRKTPDCSTVTGKQICGVNRTPNGIDVVFRTVELISNETEIDKAFPGRSGSGRNIGLNWNLDKDNKIISKVLDEKVYDEKPKYEIKLTSALIQKIRKNNKKNSYTSLGNYKFNNYSVRINNPLVNNVYNNCISGDKQACRSYSYFKTKYNEVSKDVNSKINYGYIYAASDFISDYIKKGNLTGTCTDESDTSKRAEKYSKTYGC